MGSPVSIELNKKILTKSPKTQKQEKKMNHFSFLKKKRKRKPAKGKIKYEAN